MSLARTLINHALACDLTQNELKVFLVIYSKIITYGKTADAISYSQLTKLSGIRKDRALIAAQGLIKKGLFTTTPHKLYDQTYTIHPDLLTDNDLFYFPTPPKNGKPFRNSGENPSEIRVHTINTTNTKNTTTDNEADSRRCQEFIPENLPYPQTLTPAEKQTAAQCLDGLSLQDASDCLKILDYNIQHGKITTSPIALLRGLIKQARQGTLGTHLLKPKAPTQATPTSGFKHPSPPTTQERLYQLNSDLKGLATLRHYDPSLEQQYQHKLAELQHLQPTGSIG
ncbi:replication protein [Thiofilum flexile]|uniref:replication protein n=1 Tax=Thiofilum flexile TaxID=125627 RepID=UPI0013A5AA4C|nr:replication protein [Thiofilum flexile]